MKIYRIEKEDGKGVCMVTGSPACAVYRLAARLFGEPDEFERDKFPCATEQCKAFDATALGGDESERVHMRYAFPSMEALSAWFPGREGRKAMQSVGFKGRVYEVPELVATGPHQIVFDRRKATLTEEFELGSLRTLDQYLDSLTL